MDDQTKNEARIISDTVTGNKLAVLLVIVFVVGSAIAYVAWLLLDFDQFLDKKPVDESFLYVDNNVGLDVDLLDENQFPVEGYLYVHTESVGKTGFSAYDFATARFGALPTQPASSTIAEYGPYGTVLLASSEDNLETADTIHPGWIDYQTNKLFPFETLSRWNETEAAVPPRTFSTREFVAYGAQREQFSPNNPEFYKIDNWEIIVHNAYTEITKIIPEAHQPVWVNNGEDLLFLKKDGLYHYSVSAETISPVLREWQGEIERTAQLAAAPVGEGLVMTVPQMNSIFVLSFDRAGGTYATRIQGVISSPDTTYTSPVFSPDGNRYAVLARDSKTGGRIEIRDHLNRLAVKTIDTGLDLAGSVDIVDWRLVLNPFAAR